MDPEVQGAVGAAIGVAVALVAGYALWNSRMLSLDGWPPYIELAALSVGIILACVLAAPAALRVAGQRVAGLDKAGPNRESLQPKKLATAIATADSLKHAEQQLLEAIDRHGEITPVRAALETPLTVAEADRMLSDLAKGGYLEVRVEGGKLLYSL